MEGHLQKRENSLRETTAWKVAHGTQLAIAAQAASQLISLLSLAALYRLLGPVPFGLFGMVLPFILLIRAIAYFGLNAPTIQRENISAAEVSALFWFNVLSGLGLTVCVALLSPAIAWFYGQPSLTVLTCSLAATGFLAALGTQHLALMERHLRFQALFTIRVAAHFTAALAAILVAINTRSVWALVTSQYVELAVLTGLAWRIERWRPRVPWRMANVSGLLRFAGGFTIASIVANSSLLVDKVLVGYRLGDAALGLYGQAFQMSMKPVHLISTPLVNVMLGGLSRAQQDSALFSNLTVFVVRTAAIVAFPCALGLAFIAPEVMLLLGGSQWLNAGPLLQVAALAIPAQTVMTLLPMVYVAGAKIKALLLVSIINFALLFASYLAGIWIGLRIAGPHGGLLGATWAYCLATWILLIPITLGTLAKVLDLPFMKLAKSARRPLAASLLMGAVVWSVRTVLFQLELSAIWLLLLAEISSGVIAYGILARKEIKWLMEQLRTQPAS